MSNLNFEQRMRLKFNQYACRTAYQRLEKAIGENNEHEIYSAIGELLLWVMTTHEWHKEHGSPDYKKRVYSDEKGVLLTGLAHAYNSIKHNMKLFVMHNKHNGFSFENIDFTNFDFRPITIRWIKAVNVLDEGFENQMRNYIKYLEGKEVLDTFTDALIFLNTENQVVLFDV